MSIRFIRARRMKQGRYNPRQWKKKTIMPYSYAVTIKVSREKKGTASTAKNVLRSRDFNFKTGYEKKIIFFARIYIYLHESSKILHTPVWINRRRHISTRPISTLDFLYPFYVFDTLVSRIIVMRTKSFSFIVMQSHAVVQSCA